MRDRALGSTVRLMFNTTNPDGGGAPVAPSSAFAAADIRIYKDGSASEKTTANGITVTSPFDSITGLHLVEIDTSNSTDDTGFWASGSVYHVRLVTAKTVATYSVSGLLIGEFSLELQTADVRKFGGTALTQSGGRPEVNATHWGGTAVASANVLIDGAITAAKIATGAFTSAKFASGAFDSVWTVTTRGLTETVELDPAVRVKLDATQPDYAPATPAQVNAEVVDALSVDTYAELTAPPAATSSLKDKLTWLFMYARNKVTQTATQRKLYRDDGTTVAGTSGTTDDGTTFTKGEDA